MEIDRFTETWIYFQAKRYFKKHFDGDLLFGTKITNIVKNHIAKYRYHFIISDLPQLSKVTFCSYEDALPVFSGSHFCVYKMIFKPDIVEWLSEKNYDMSLVLYLQSNYVVPVIAFNEIIEGTEFKLIWM